jgi:ABC-type uncharacterized transport system substrate-binding protein
LGVYTSKIIGGAPSLGVTLQVHDIRTADDLPAAFDAAAKEHAEALLTTAESIFVAQRARVTELAARYKLPAMYCYSTHVADFGGLMAYDVSYPDVIRRAASYVDRILKGAKASDLPVEQQEVDESILDEEGILGVYKLKKPVASRIAETRVAQCNRSGCRAWRGLQEP